MSRFTTLRTVVPNLFSLRVVGRRLSCLALLAVIATGVAVGQTTVIGVNPGGASSDPTEIVAFNGMFYFAATDALNGRELWRSNGVTASLVADINPGAGSSDPMWLTVVGSQLFFGADDGTTGRELWKTDGVTTTLVANIAVGAARSDPQYLTEFNGELFFSADNGSFASGFVGRELWKSSGLGAVLVKDIFTGGIGVLGITNSGTPEELTVSNGILFFRATDAEGVELWKSNGSVGNAVRVANIFAGSSGIPPQPNSSTPTHLRDFGGTLFFAAATAAGNELWESDGTGAGTMIVADINAGAGSSNPENLLVVGSKIFFSANDGAAGTELWTYPGSGGGATLVLDIRGGPSSSLPREFRALGSTLVFQANDGLVGAELWRSNGTGAGTTLVKDINPAGSSSPAALTAITGACGSGLVFRANDGASGVELWRTDGSVSGTSLVQDINPGPLGSNPGLFVPSGLIVFFRCNDGTNGVEPAVISSGLFGDTTPPTVSCPSGTTVNADGSCAAGVPDFAALATASDNCGSVALSQTPSAGSVVGLGLTVVTVVATDGSGNNANCTVNLTVIDATAPSVTCPPTHTLTADPLCQAVLPDLTTLATVLDNCGGGGVSQSPAAGTILPLGPTSVILTATDGAGNVANCTIGVVVVDASPPTVTCPGTQTVAAGPGCTASLPDVASLAAGSDNCTTVTFTQSPVAGSSVGAGSHLVTVTGSDAAGNTAICTVTVTVTDTTPPTVTCGATQSATADTLCQAPVPDFTATSTGSDNCGPVTLTQSPAAGTLVGLGTTPVTVTATDGAGNATPCGTSFTVTDATPPSVSCGAAQSGTADASCQAAVPDFTATSTGERQLRPGDADAVSSRGDAGRPGHDAGDGDGDGRGGQRHPVRDELHGDRCHASERELRRRPERHR